MTNYKYHLQPYSPTSKKTCPACGRSKCFTLYLDEANRPAGPEYGICDHAGCGYRRYPSNNVEPQNFAAPVVMPSLPPLYYTKDDVRQYRRADLNNALCRFLLQKFNRYQFSKVLKDYCIGSVDDAIIFWQIDLNYRIHRGKVMWYKSDGHRMKLTRPDGTEYGKIRMMWQFLNRSRDREPEMCYFGEHLAALYPRRPVALVESEKTALIMSYYVPQFNWMATLSLNNFQSYRLNFLKFHHTPIYVFPDFDGFDKWSVKAQAIAATMPNAKIIVDDFITVAGAGKEDIADVFLRKGYDVYSQFQEHLKTKYETQM